MVGVSGIPVGEMVGDTVPVGATSSFSPALERRIPSMAPTANVTNKTAPYIAFRFHFGRAGTDKDDEDDMAGSACSISGG